MFVDVVGTFEKLSPHGIISGDLVYDNVHPSVRGQQIISDEILHALAQNNKVAPQKEWQWASLEAAREDRDSEEWKVDGSVNAYRYILQGLQFWEHQNYSEAIIDLEKGLEMMPGFLESYAFLGDAYSHLGNQVKASKAFKTLMEKDPALSQFLLRKYPEIQQSYTQISQLLLKKT